MKAGHSRQIAELEAEVAQEVLDALQADRAQLITRLNVVNSHVLALQPRAMRADELEKLLAPPPPDSGIVTVTYSEGG